LPVKRFWFLKLCILISKLSCGGRGIFVSMVALSGPGVCSSHNTASLSVRSSQARGCSWSYWKCGNRTWPVQYFLSYRQFVSSAVLASYRIESRKCTWYNLQIMLSELRGDSSNRDECPWIRFFLLKYSNCPKNIPSDKRELQFTVLQYFW
jgi:hypothetical protein